MKLTTKILIGMLLFFIMGLFVSNMILNKEYEKKDKNDTYWTYENILEKPFKYLKIKGGNLSNIAYEQSKNSSVRVFKNWDKKSNVKAEVKNDTLFVTFPNTYKDQYEKDWMKWFTLVRIFSPELLSVDGFDTKLEMYKLKQKSLTVNMKGKSEFEVESMDPHFDSLKISARDSSQIVFEMSPDFKISESFHVRSVSADIQGASIVDVGHAQIDSLQLTVADSSAVLLSGGTLKRHQFYNTGITNK